MNNTLEELRKDLNHELEERSNNEKVMKTVSSKLDKLRSEYTNNVINGIFSNDLDAKIASVQSQSISLRNKLRKSDAKIAELMNFISEKEKILKEAKEEAKKEAIETNKKLEQQEEKEQLKKDIQETIDESLSDTVELPVIEDEDTLELDTKEIKAAKQIPQEKVIENAKIVFDGKTGLFTASAIVDYEPQIRTNLIDRELLNNPDGLQKNLEETIRKFNNDYGTKIKVEDCKIVYDFRKFKKIDESILPKKMKRKIKKSVKKESKDNINVNYITFLNKNAAPLLVGTAIVAGIGGIGGVAYNISNKSVVSNKNQTATEKTLEDEYVKQESTGKVKVDNTIIKVKPAPPVDLNMPIDEEDEVVTYYDNDGNEISKEQSDKLKEEYVKQESTGKIDTEENTINKNIENKNEEYVKQESTGKFAEEKDFVIGDSLGNIENIDIYYSSEDRSAGKNPALNSEKFSQFNPNYDISLMAVVHDGKFSKVVRDNSMTYQELKKECESQFGNDYEIWFNANITKDGEIIYKNLGWFDSSEVLNINNEKMTIHK